MPDWAELSWVIGAVLGCLGVVVVLVGVFRDRSRGRRRCSRCWYDMAGGAGLPWPECGRVHRNERRLLRTRRSRRVIALGVFLSVLALVTAVAPAAYTGK